MSQTYYPEKVDMNNCDREPIHIIGQSQEYGVIVACDRESFTITQIGQNSLTHFGIDFQDLLGSHISSLIGKEHAERLKDKQSLDEVFTEVQELEVNGSQFLMKPNISGSDIILDFEPINNVSNPFEYQKKLTKILNTLGASKTPEELCINAAKITRNFFGYDRVMIYKFDEEWNGEVIAEEKEEDLESWLGLHYPASDIPKQSRKLFLEKRIRIITDVNYKPVLIEPQLSPLTKQPLDLSNSDLRGVSPIHIEYLQNMGVGASLTAALISNGKLWGLLACHNYSPKFLSYYERQTCDFLTQIFSNEISLKETNKYLSKLGEWSEIKTKLVEQIKREGKIKKGLLEHSVLFTDLLECNGGAIYYNNKLRLIGETPSEDEVRTLIENFLSNQQSSLFFTKALHKIYAPAIDFQDTASGVLSVKLGEASQNFLIWFRPEVVKKVTWGGNPKEKGSYDEEKQRITPRKSFEKWTQQLKGVSDSWKDYQIDAAKAISENLSSIILEKQKKEIDQLNQKLIKAHKELELFSQGLSHDLKAPLRGIDGYAQILREDFWDLFDDTGKEAVTTIQRSSADMTDLIDNILSFAGISNKDLKKKNFNPTKLVKDLLKAFNTEVNFPQTVISVEKDLARMKGDKRMLSRVWSNLITNALKYSEFADSPEVKIGSEIIDGRTVYYVSDNGIGIDPANCDKIFNLFSRFSGSAYKGTGIGLAITQKIIEKHQGKIWVESELNKGSVFYFHV